MLPKVENDKSVTLDLDGVVAFQSEEYTIPEQELIPSFRFYYMTAPAHYAYWPLTFTGWAETTEKFLGKPASLAEAVASTVSVSDSSEQKLRKLSARVQRVRNLSHEGGRTSQELKREEIKENKSAQDVWKRGYGTGRDIDLLFVALARASGFDSYFVRYAGRNRSFFHRDLLDASQFNGFLAMAKLKKADGGTENVFLDPAVPGLSYGMLDWDSTGVEAVHLDSRGGKFIHIPVELSRGGAILRTAAFDLGASGGLSGSAVVSFTRQDALWRRKQAKEGELDEMQKREDLEDTVRAWLGDGATVQLIRMSGWEDSEQSITAEFSLQIPDFASFTRRRLLAPATVFRTHRLLQQAMQYSNRTLPFYFQYPWEEDDDIIIHLPAGAEVEQLPTPVNKETPLGRYQASCVKEPGALHIKRQLAIREVYYGDPAPLREFFNSVRVNDENLALLRGTAAGVQAQVGSSR